MAEFVKLKKELVNGRYRNIYTKKNGKRQYVKSDGNYVLLSVFNKKSKKPSKTNKPLTQHRNRTIRGGFNYTSDENIKYRYKEDGIKYVIDNDNIKEFLQDPISYEHIKYEDAYIFQGSVFDFNNLYKYVVENKGKRVFAQITITDIIKLILHKNQEHWNVNKDQYQTEIKKIILSSKTVLRDIILINQDLQPKKSKQIDDMLKLIFDILDDFLLKHLIETIDNLDMYNVNLDEDFHIDRLKKNIQRLNNKKQTLLTNIIKHYTEYTLQSDKILNDNYSEDEKSLSTISDIEIKQMKSTLEGIYTYILVDLKPKELIKFEQNKAIINDKQITNENMHDLSFFYIIHYIYFMFYKIILEQIPYVFKEHDKIILEIRNKIFEDFDKIVRNVYTKLNDIYAQESSS